MPCIPAVSHLFLNKGLTPTAFFFKEERIRRPLTFAVCRPNCFFLRCFAVFCASGKKLMDYGRNFYFIVSGCYRTAQVSECLSLTGRLFPVINLVLTSRAYSTPENVHTDVILRQWAYSCARYGAGLLSACWHRNVVTGTDCDRMHVWPTHPQQQIQLPLWILCTYVSPHSKPFVRQFQISHSSMLENGPRGMCMSQCDSFHAWLCLSCVKLCLV